MGYEKIEDDGELIKTKRDWKCEWCGQKIARGELAIKRIYKWDGEFNNQRQHRECYTAMNLHTMNEGDGEFELHHMERPTEQQTNNRENKMSTRASVIIKDDRDMLFFYQHSDGCPSGLGEWLSKFLLTEEAKRHQGDIEYFSAAVIMHCNNDYERTKYPDLVPAVSVHGDEQYQYIIDCDKLVMETRSKRQSFLTEQPTNNREG